MVWPYHVTPLFQVSFSQKFHFCHYFFSKIFLSICSRNLDCVSGLALYKTSLFIMHTYTTVQVGQWKTIHYRLQKSDQKSGTLLILPSFSALPLDIYGKTMTQTDDFYGLENFIKKKCPLNILLHQYAVSLWHLLGLQRLSKKSEQRIRNLWHGR